MRVKLALRTDIIGQVEDVVYENARYDVIGSFLIITISPASGLGPTKVFPVHRVFFVEVTHDD